MKMKIDKLSFSYTNVPFLEDISFSIMPQDQCIFLCGKNGAGKSTLLNLLTGLLPNEGQIIREDTKIIFLPYEDPLLLNLSVQDNLQFFYRSFHRRNIPLDDPFIAALLEVLSIDYLSQKVSLCSSGERKKVALACMLLADADLVVLDEPFVAIDYQSVEAVITLINQLKKEKVFFITTHSFSLAPRMCDRLIVLEAGKLTKDSNNKEEIHSYFKGEKHVSTTS